MARKAVSEKVMISEFESDGLEGIPVDASPLQSAEAVAFAREPAKVLFNEPMISFSVWFQSRGLPAHHMGPMLDWLGSSGLGNFRRTKSLWDEIMKGY